MRDYELIGNGIVCTAKVAMIALCLSVPLAIWKLVEINIWIYRHIHVVIN